MAVVVQFADRVTLVGFVPDAEHPPVVTKLCNPLPVVGVPVTNMMLPLPVKSVQTPDATPAVQVQAIVPSSLERKPLPVPKHPVVRVRLVV